MSLGEAHIVIDQIGKTRTWKTGEFDHSLGRGINFQIKVVENIDFLFRTLMGFCSDSLKTWDIES